MSSLSCSGCASVYCSYRASFFTNVTSQEVSNDWLLQDEVPEYDLFHVYALKPFHIVPFPPSVSVPYFLSIFIKVDWYCWVSSF